MNILYLAPEGFDYLSNQLTEGLWLLQNKKHYGAHCELYPCIDDVNLKCLNKVVHHKSQIDDLPLITPEEAADSINWADMILFSSGGDMKFLDGVTGMIMGMPEHRHKLVFVDGHDSNQALIAPEQVALYIKRELRYPLPKPINFRSMTFGVYQYLIDAMLANTKTLDEEWEARDIDVSFMAFGRSNSARPEVAQLCEQIRQNSIDHDALTELKMEIHCSDEGQPIPQGKYHDILYRTKVGVSVEGAGVDTLRFWETPAHGAVLCAHQFYNLLWMRNPFEPGRHAHIWDDAKDCAMGLYVIPNDKDMWKRMRRASDNLILRHHTTMHRAIELIEMFKEVA